ncbi:MAG: YncE family protein [Deltaproteobacteria bacterium]|nr:MAG: YncE family protein [Deltaproteobacteria bacterium]
MHCLRWPPAFSLLLMACQAQAAAPPLLRKVTDVPLPGAASRFDYASLDPGRGRLYLNHMGAGEVVVFDIRTRKVAAVLKGFPRCTGILAVPTLDRVFVSTPGDGHVVALDGKTYAVLARLPAGRFPDGIAFEAGSGRIFVSDEAGGAVTAIDASALKVLKQYLDLPRNLAFIASETNNELLVLDLAGRKITAHFPLGRGPDVLSFDTGSRRLYVASESGTLSVFRESGAGLVKEGEPNVGPNAHVVIVDPASHLLYLPLKEVDGHPVLRILEPVLPATP